MDEQVSNIIQREAERQHSTIELIASENHVSSAVRDAVGSCLTNKYAEGYPGKRYYGGCENYDDIESLAQERAKMLFNCNFANVQPHSGASANIAVFLAFLNPGEKFASLVLSDGGHLSHGLKINISGKYFTPVHYPLINDSTNPLDATIDYEALRNLCLTEKPKMIICGYSAYPRVIDFLAFRRIADEINAILVSDIAHIAGLIAAGVHPSPFPYSDIVTTTTQKTLRGPRGGMILSNDEEIATKIDKAIFPGSQGGPFMHIIAGKAVYFGEALRPEFKRYAKQIVSNAKTLASSLMEKGYKVVSGGTDTHLLLLDLREKDENLTGKEAETWLVQSGLTVNKNTVPNETRSPFVTSGLRLGTPAVTTRGMGTKEMEKIADWMDSVILSNGDSSVQGGVRKKVANLCSKFPLPH